MAGLLNQRLGCQRQCWIRRWMSRRLRATKKHDCITGVNITACHHDVLTSGHEGHSRTNGKTVGLHPANEGSTPSTVHYFCPGGERDIMAPSEGAGPGS